MKTGGKDECNVISGRFRWEALRDKFLGASRTVGAAATFVQTGDSYDYGYGVEINYESAAQFYEKAVNVGDADALSRLAHMYVYGQGVEMNMDKARELFQRGADCDEACALAWLGLFYERSDGDICQN